MKIKICTVSDIEEMKRIEPLWNAFIAKHSSSPFLFSGFVNQLLKLNVKDFKPHILVFSIDNKIVGVVPLEVRNGLFRSCRFLPIRDFQPDFVFDPRYKELFLRETGIILFRNMECNLVHFSLPAISQYPSVLKQVCRELGAHFSSKPEMGRAIMHVNGSWIQYEKSRKHLRRDVERMERCMEKMGQLNIKWFGKGDNVAQVLKGILEVERASWKRKQSEVDPFIPFVLNGCVQTSLIEPSFNWGVALLELNGKAIAYSMFLEYNGHAYICKTSFDNSYRTYGPGICINHAVVRELFNRTNVKVIDFLTDLPFLHRWASEVVPVNNFIMSQKGIAPLLYLYVIATKPFRLLIKLLKPLLENDFSVSTMFLIK
jgi:CelD/BcsL family acetyltransferase involved in cellulose biosynthesis